MLSTTNLAKQITRKGSLQSYYTIKLLCDSGLSDDCFKAYAYFRWVDDMVDDILKSRTKCLSFINRQGKLIKSCYSNTPLSTHEPQEEILVSLINSPTGRGPRLKSFIHNFYQIIKFDVQRKGRLITGKELDWYSHTLGVAVTDCIQHFIGNDHPYPSSPHQYHGAIAAHITHMLRDYLDDVEQGYINIPKKFVDTHDVNPHNINHPSIRHWVQQRVITARNYFQQSKSYLNNIEVLRCKMAGYLYCARFEPVLDQIEKDDFILRHKYSDHRKYQTLAQIAALIPRTAVKHTFSQSHTKTPLKTAIVIGAGIGGLGTAIKLARDGCNVTIFEKNTHPGGRCGRIKKDGHLFDTGPTMYLFPDLYSRFFLSIGEDVNDHLQLNRADPIYRLNFPDHTHLTLTSDMNKMKKQLESLETGSYDKFKSFLKAGKGHYQLAIDHITAKSLDHFHEYFNTYNAYLLYKHQALWPHYAYTGKFFKHPHLRAAFTFQDSYLSLNPFTSPSIFSLFPYSELVHGNYLPKGGMFAVITALEKIARKYGVTIHYSQPVKEIIQANNQVTGVGLADSSVHSADLVIVNADLSYSYKHLLPKKFSSDSFSKKNASCSAIVFHWGLDCRIPNLETHNLFFSDSFKEGFEQVIDSPTPPNQPHFYIQAPSRTDPDRAPKNQDTLTVMVPINHLDPNHNVDWSGYKDRLRAYIFSRLDKTCMKDVKNHIKFEIVHLPQNWHDYLNLTHGSVYGLHHHLLQLGYLRPKRQHPKLYNLYFVGASTHPGSGLPTVLQSAEFTYQKILSNSYHG